MKLCNSGRDRSRCPTTPIKRRGTIRYCGWRGGLISPLSFCNNHLPLHLKNHCIALASLLSFSTTESLPSPCWMLASCHQKFGASSCAKPRLRQILLMVPCDPSCYRQQKLFCHLTPMTITRPCSSVPSCHFSTCVHVFSDTEACACSSVPAVECFSNAVPVGAHIHY